MFILSEKRLLLQEGADDPGSKLTSDASFQQVIRKHAVSIIQCQGMTIWVAAHARAALAYAGHSDYSSCVQHGHRVCAFCFSLHLTKGGLTMRSLPAS